MTDKPYMMTASAAWEFGVTPETFRRWVDQKKIQVRYYRTPGGHRRYRRDDVMREAKTQDAG